MFRYKYLHILFLFSLISITVIAKEERPIKVSLIHSYKSSYPNYEYFNSNIKAQFLKHGFSPEFNIFYLGSEEIEKQEQLVNLLEGYIQKIEYWEPDIIIVNDDAAVKSLMKCKNPLLNKIPIIFGGVNFMEKNEFLLRSNFKGFMDTPDYKTNVEFIERLLGPSNILIGIENSSSDKESLKLLRKQIKSKWSISNAKRTENLNEDSLIDSFYLSLLKGKTTSFDKTYIQILDFSKIKSFTENQKIQYDNIGSLYLNIKYSPVSLLAGLFNKKLAFTAVYEPFLYKDMPLYMGGYFTSIDILAKEEVGLAAEVLNGTDITKIPIAESKKEYVVMWNGLQRYQISKSKVPSDTKIIGMPAIYKYSKKIYWIFSMVLLVLIYFVYQTVLVFRKEKKEYKLSMDKMKKTLAKSKEIARTATESDRLKAVFLANASHEIRTPINTIVGFSNILATSDDLSKEDKETFAEAINTNNNILLGVINNVLELSLLESGRFSFKQELVDVVDLVVKICNELKAEIHPGVKLLIIKNTSPIILNIDSKRIYQVVKNVISNAIKFTETGRIKFKTEISLETKEIFLIVEDSGKGIPEDKYSFIFERFAKLDDFSQGPGLGLPICVEILKHYKGRMTVHSEGLGKGSTFSIILPLDLLHLEQK